MASQYLNEGTTTFNRAGPGVSEGQLSAGSGLRVGSVTEMLVPDPTLWLSGAANGPGDLGTAVLSVPAVSEAYTEFPVVGQDPTIATVPLRGGVYAGISVTPCIRVTVQDATLTGKWFQLRLTGENLRGETVVQETPAITLPAIAGETTWTYYTWASIPVVALNKIEYRGALTTDNRIDIGVVHPLDFSSLTAVNAFDANMLVPATYGSASKASVLGGTVLQFNHLWNYGIEMPFDIDGGYIISNLAANTKTATGAEKTILGGHLWNLGSLASDHSSSEDTTVDINYINPFNGAQEGANPVNLVGGFFVNANSTSTVTDNGVWPGATRKIKIQGLTTGTAALDQQLRQAAGSTHPGTWGDSFLLNLKFRSNAIVGGSQSDNAYPTTGF